MDLNLLKTFDAVMKSESVNDAADILGITAPAVSHALNRLRDQYQDPLFIRQGRGIAPTNFAIELHVEIQEPLSLLLNGAISRQDFDPLTSQRTFRISSHKDIDLIVVPPIVDYKRKHAPNIMIKADVEHQYYHERQDDLRHRKVDLILATALLEDHGYHNQFLFEQQLVVAVSKHHPRIQDKLTLTDFFNEYHLLWSTKTLDNYVLNSLADEDIPHRKVAYATGSLSTALVMASQTDWICVTSSWHANKMCDALDLNIFPLPFASKKVPIYMTWHHSQRHDGGNKWLREALIETTAALR